MAPRGAEPNTGPRQGKSRAARRWTKAARAGVIALCVAGCNSRRFVSEGPSGVGDAWGETASGAVASGATSSDAVPGAGSNEDGETAAVATDDAVLTSDSVTSRGASWQSGADATETAASAASDSGEHAPSGDSSHEGAAQTAGASSATDDDASAPLNVPASLTERAAHISELPGCEPDEIVTVARAAVLDFDSETELQLASGLLTFSADDQTLDAVLAWYQDDTGNYALEFTSGADGSSHGVRATNSDASGWGGGVAIVVQCVDASRFQGVEFWLKGETPVGTAVFGVDARAEESGSVELPIDGTWTRHRVAFAELAASASGPGNTVLDGSAVRALVWSSQLRYVEQPPRSGNWVAAPGAFQIAVDQVRFY